MASFVPYTRSISRWTDPFFSGKNQILLRLATRTRGQRSYNSPPQCRAQSPRKDYPFYRILIYTRACRSICARDLFRHPRRLWKDVGCTPPRDGGFPTPRPRRTFRRSTSRARSHRTKILRDGHRKARARRSSRSATPTRAPRAPFHTRRRCRCLADVARRIRPARARVRRAAVRSRPPLARASLARSLRSLRSLRSSTHARAPTPRPRARLSTAPLGCCLGCCHPCTRSVEMKHLENIFFSIARAPCGASWEGGTQSRNRRGMTQEMKTKKKNDTTVDRARVTHGIHARRCLDDVSMMSR